MGDASLRGRIHECRHELAAKEMLPAVKLAFAKGALEWAEEAAARRNMVVGTATRGTASGTVC